MKYLSILLLLLPIPAFAGDLCGLDAKARPEVIRRGDLVEYISGNISSTNGITQAMEMPEDDSDKWFVSLVGQKGCSACIQLKGDWIQSDYLRSIAVPGSPKLSWAHFNYYDYNDASQSWRWKNIDFRGFPSIIIQPPRNKDYGPVKDIVFFQAGYDGDPEKLTRKMIDAIKLRIEKFSTPTQQARAPPEEGVIGVDPPWDVEPDSTPDRRPLRPLLVPDVPPEPEPIEPTSEPFSFPSWAIPMIFAGGPLSWVGIAALVWFGFVFIRNWRKSQGKKLVINDQMMLLLQMLADKFNLEDDPEEEDTPEPIKKATRKRIVRRKTK